MMELLRQFLLIFGEEFKTYQSSIILKKTRDIVLDVASRKQDPCSRHR